MSSKKQVLIHIHDTAVETSNLYLFPPLDCVQPTAAFSWEVKDPIGDPLNVTFTDKSTGDIDDWLWDFGDGDTSADQNPVHEFTDPGVYKVTLTVSNDEGEEDT